jgi:predicted dehydrogenase
MGALGPRVRWGILGTGRMAGEFALALHRVPEAELVAVGSRDLPRAVAFARAGGAARAYGSYEELVSDAAVDVVYVATPNSQHREHCRLALAAGRAVLCEKPFATNGREARDIVALAREKRLFCMEGLWTRFFPLVERAEALVREGRIGEPLAFQADFGVAFSSRDHRVFRPELGGGALLDLGVYLLAMARSFLGPPLEATGQLLVGPTGVDEQASVLLRHPGDRHSLLLASLRSETAAGAVVLGTTGRLRIHPPFYRPHRVSVERFAGASGGSAGAPAPVPAAWKAMVRPLYQRFEGVFSAIARRPVVDILQPVEGNGYQHEAVEVARCLRAGAVESPRMPLDESIALMDTLDQLRGLSSGSG